MLGIKEHDIELKDNAVFIGAGGAARSIAYELAHEVSRIDF